MIVYCFNPVTEQIQPACSVSHLTEHNFLLLIYSSEGSGYITLQENRHEFMYQFGVANEVVVRQGLFGFKHKPAGVPLHKNHCAPQTSLQGTGLRVYILISESLLCLFRHKTSSSETNLNGRQQKPLHSLSHGSLLYKLLSVSKEEIKNAILLFSFIPALAVFLQKIVCKYNKE